MLYTFRIVLIFYLIYTAHGVSITPNYKSSCTLLGSRIYCYSGGYIALGDAYVRRAINEHHYLDLTQRLVLYETTSKWVIVTGDTHYITEGALAGTATSISDSQYIEDGGYNESPFVKNVTRLFDANSVKWNTISNDNRSSESAM
ncbi:hypothetical protein BD408DRAFT_423047 [Parasitella parasitica]|nr:hypothetical protein BD408DRAFT_423047 [Parasitella parasitica]